MCCSRLGKAGPLGGRAALGRSDDIGSKPTSKSSDCYNPQRFIGDPRYPLKWSGPLWQNESSRGKGGKFIFEEICGIIPGPGKPVKLYFLFSISFFLYSLHVAFPGN